MILLSLLAFSAGRLEEDNEFAEFEDEDILPLDIPSPTTPSPHEVTKEAEEASWMFLKGCFLPHENKFIDQKMADSGERSRACDEQWRVSWKNKIIRCTSGLIGFLL